MSSQQKAEALKKAKELQYDRQMYVLLTLVMTTAAAGTGGLPFALMMGSMGVMSDYFFKCRTAGILNGNYSAKINWCIDPSGYVFDFDTGERLADVKTTLYYIPYDENDSNYWDKPQTDKSVIWEASEYSQQNPIFTDRDGNYAWDVPEGWWQVKYELEGYETVFSDWLIVPPPQMNVNIGMKKLSSFTIGDVNNDGKVNMKDYAKLQQYLNDGTIDINELAADLNGDSKINMKDYALLLRKLNGWAS